MSDKVQAVIQEELPYWREIKTLVFPPRTALPPGQEPKIYATSFDVRDAVMGNWWHVIGDAMQEMGVDPRLPLVDASDEVVEVMSRVLGNDDNAQHEFLVVFVERSRQ